jgi:glycosyltransferase involved in cell wall biosynthesis
VSFSWDVPLTDGYECTFLSNDERIGGVDGFFRLRAGNLEQHLREFRPDCALINAYMPYFWWEVFYTLRKLRIPVIMRAETTDSALPRGVLKERIRSTVLGYLYRRCEKLLAIGRNARQHFLFHGVPLERIGWAPYCIDSDLFGAQAERLLPQRTSLRRELGFQESQTVFIYSGKMIPKKDPMTLAMAIQGMAHADRQGIGLIALGDGELRMRFEAICRDALGLRFVTPGFVNQSEMGRYYSAADCLILPSAWGETWGLVINEAMQFGVPAIVSHRVGCHPDLVVEGETGYVFPTGDSRMLKKRMLEFKETTREERISMTKKCRDKVAGYSVEAASTGIHDAILGIGNSCYKSLDPLDGG